MKERSSALAVQYHQDFPEMIVWWGASVECSSALARLERDSGLETADLTRALKQLQALQSTWNEVQPLDSVRTSAQRLLRLHPLRAADALQLASALVAAENRPQTWEFVCLDNRLAAAAEREGFSINSSFVQS